MKLYKYLIISILIIATFLRLFQLKTYPVSLFSDEVDAGYQAMVYNKCFTDYFGNKLPFHFHSFADYRTPFYIYSIALVQKFTSNFELSVRLPAVIFGILTCYAIFLLTLELTKSKKTALIALTIASISPWLIHYSRAGFEVTGMLFFLILGMYFFLKDKWFHSILFLAISAYFYSTAKLFIVTLTIAILFLFPNKIKSLNYKKIILLIIFTLIIGFPYIKDTLSGKSGFRFSYINIFSDSTISKNIDYLRYEDSLTTNPNQVGVKTSLSSKIIHNKITQISNKFINNYISSFNTNFLFLEGDANLRHSPKGTGLLYPFEIFLIISGIVIFSKSKYFPFLITYLLLSPISFALTNDSNGPHATRLILMLPILIIFISVSIDHLSSKSKIYSIIISSLYIWFLANSIHYYIFHYPHISARSWHYGVKQALEISQPLEANYPKLFFSNKFEPSLPFFLFYRQYLPSDCNPAAHIKNDTIDNKYFLGPIDYNLAKGNVVIMPLTEYNENKDILQDFSIKQTTEKKYTEQEQFIILLPK